MSDFIRSTITICGALVFGLPWAGAQIPLIAEPVACLPIGDNAVAWAEVSELPPDSSVRLNFHRLNSEAEEFYWVAMYPHGDGRYWGIFPKPESHDVDRDDLEQQREDAKEDTRFNGKSLVAMDDDYFEDWLDELENEPVEYYVSANDALGIELARSEVLASFVFSSRECEVELTKVERGEADNLTVGETAFWQRGQLPFHWMCAGIVSRIDPDAVKRGDEVCRSCVPCPTAVGDIIYGYETRTVSPSRF
ncbi:MAG: hypothetical protein GY906_13450 [bacterium]|nr:hypothetical protein [bacterium]